MKADLHIHTKYSGIGGYWKLKFPDSIEEPRNIMKYAKKKDLSVIAITDHNTIRGGLETKKFEKEFGIDVVVGSEIITKDGEIIGLYLNEEIPKHLSAEETIEKIHEQGGLAIAPHPYSPICSALGDKIFKLDLDGVEAFNAYHRDGIINNFTLKKIKQNFSSTNSHSKSFAYIGGSDAHIARMVGNAYTIFKGDSSEELYHAIIKGETFFWGSSTPLLDIILWSYNIVYASEKELIKSIILKNPTLNMKLNTKILAIIGGLTYLSTPLPILAGLFGNYYLKYKAKHEVKEHQILYHEV
ncbi:PHP domain-containing protein [Methanothermococcus sp. Ax23]|uniref:PHP-associated domain-containing protein n=1 Tax=Methanothermococcus sp. Ax23 TaxID=3156486 RepID=UPI003B9EAECF